MMNKGNRFQLKFIRISFLELILNRSIIEIDNELPPDLLLTHRPYSPILFANSFENECDSIFRGQWKFQKNFTTFHKHFKTDRVLRTSKRTIYTAGRPPWFDAQGQSKESFLIGYLCLWICLIHSK